MIINNRVYTLYGIDYTTYICGGIGLHKIQIQSYETELFYKESDMIKRLAELKEKECVDDIQLFATNIIRDKYKIN